MTAWPDSDSLKKSLAMGIRMLAQAEIMDYNGHFSVRVPGTGHILINSAACVRNALTASDIVTIDESGVKQAGNDAPPMEMHIHTEIYKARPDVQTIIHAHPRWSTYFSMTGVPVQPVFPQASLLGSIPTFDCIFSVNTPELGAALADVLGPSRAALLKSHGCVVTGAGIEEAFALCVYLEENAKRQYMAQALGTPYVLSAQEIESCAQHLRKPHLYRKVWDYYEANCRR